MLAGATTLLIAGSSAFAVTGGWAIIGNGQQVIRYTGITVSSLTGIPASGAGAITRERRLQLHRHRGASVDRDPARRDARRGVPGRRAAILVRCHPRRGARDGSAVARDGSTNGGLNTPSYTHTTSGSNRVLFVVVQAITLDGVTYNGVPMALLGSAWNQGAGSSAMIYGLAAPASGAHTVLLQTPYGVYRLVRDLLHRRRQTAIPDAIATTPTVGPAATHAGTVTTATADAWTLMATINNISDAGAGSVTTTKLHSSAGAGLNVFDSNGSVGVAGGVGAVRYPIVSGEPSTCSCRSTTPPGRSRSGALGSDRRAQRRGRDPGGLPAGRAHRPRRSARARDRPPGSPERNRRAPRLCRPGSVDDLRATIWVDLPAPTNVTAAFKIQRVHISGFSANPAVFPTYTVEASPVSVLAR